MLPPQPPIPTDPLIPTHPPTHALYPLLLSSISNRKDVLVKSGKTVGGGDSSRKKKLLDKQKKGKKRAKTVGKVELTQEAFWAVLAGGAGGASR